MLVIKQEQNVMEVSITYWLVLPFIIKSVWETIENEAKEQKGCFVGML